MKKVLVMVGAVAALLTIGLAAGASAVGRSLYGLGQGAPEGDASQTAVPPYLPAGAGTMGYRAVRYALSQLGVPYRWGGETAGVGFDCSGLVQAAYEAAGTSLPRVAAEQMAAGPAVPPGTPLAPGDLVFFGPGTGGATHVGLVVDPTGTMIDAPHSGASVRLEPFPIAPGARWGDELYLGATGPGRRSG